MLQQKIINSYKTRLAVKMPGCNMKLILLYSQYGKGLHGTLGVAVITKLPATG